MVEMSIVYIRTEPITPATACSYVNGPQYRCTIEFNDGSTVMRCGVTSQHALANAVAVWKTMSKRRFDLK